MDPLRHEEQRLRRMAQLAGKGRILDIGFMNWPNRYFHGQVVGLDLIGQKIAPYYCHVIRGNAQNLPFTGRRFDAIVAGELIEHLSNPLSFLCECNRILKQDGHLVLSTPNPHYPTEILKNILLCHIEVSGNTHIAVFPYQMMVKLASLTGFRLEKFLGDYVRLPKLGIKFRLSLLPSMCVHHIYAFAKVRDVTTANLNETLEQIREKERIKFSLLHS